MRTFTAVVAAALLGISTFASAAEMGDQCAWGLANGKHVKTDCSVNMEKDGKTYCFSSKEAKDSFMKAPEKNMTKAKETYGRA